MPILKTIIKNNFRETIVKLVGFGSETINLADLVAGTQEAGTSSFTVSILDIISSMSPTGVFTATRDGENVISVYGNYRLNNDGVIRYTFDSKKSSNINVTLSEQGMVILRLSKLGGYTKIFDPIISEYLFLDEFNGVVGSLMAHKADIGGFWETKFASPSPNLSGSGLLDLSETVTVHISPVSALLPSSSSVELTVNFLANNPMIQLYSRFDPVTLASCSIEFTRNYLSFRTQGAAGGSGFQTVVVAQVEYNVSTKYRLEVTNTVLSVYVNDVLLGKFTDTTKIPNFTSGKFMIKYEPNGSLVKAAVFESIKAK